MYQLELQRLLDEVWDETKLLASIDLYADQIRSAESSETYTKELNLLREWIKTRRTQVEQELAGKIAVGAHENQACEEGFPGIMIDLVARFGFAW